VVFLAPGKLWYVRTISLTCAWLNGYAAEDFSIEVGFDAGGQKGNCDDARLPSRVNIHPGVHDS
jgi:hypothetical protein